ncbi:MULTISPECIES: hypothetical protein [unclassified Mycobacterium]|uniref:hypothetical protein n=1 Tax=unclassified Mycobacterium TaxID=2642494 RepID=UPI0007FDEDB5|nr:MULTISPECIES: hypothetical protein [unclassified Mycobacterium]OBG99675.1 hypothetical protein A5696_18590 [Mycobacterium sp. E2699]OBI47849.1 hypothetical protein A5705_17590 [Mycobacterium sp. E787]
MPGATGRNTDDSRRPSERIRDAERIDLKLPVIGHVRIPTPDHLAFYGGLAALAALQLLDWPVALVLGAGQALAENQHSRVVQQFGDALEDA